MIHLVTLNPSLDLLFRIKEPTHGKIGTVPQAEMAAGGKGLNVARFLRELGTPHRLWLGAGGGGHPTHVTYRSLLQADGLAVRFFRNPNPIRMNVVLEKGGTADKYNQEGESLSSGVLRDTRNQLQKALKPEDCLVLTGRLPASNSKVYADLVRLAQKRKAFSLVDASGAALGNALSAHPWLFKVNLFELEEALGKKIGNLRGLARLIPALRKRGLVQGVVTHGSRGAILWNEKEALAVNLKVKPQKLVVGAGDVFLAGYLKAFQGRVPLEERARWACAAGAVVAAHGIGGFRRGLAESYWGKVIIKPVKES